MNDVITAGFGRAAKRNLATKLPPRLLPIRDLLTADDEQSRVVLDDWIKEQAWNVAHDLFLVSRPTNYQKTITRLVIGRGTTIEQCFEHIRAGGNIVSDVLETFAEAKRQLTIHQHALWVRLIKDHQGTTAQGDECLLTREGKPLGHRDGKAKYYIQFRARCTVLGCVMASYPTQHIVAEHPLLARVEPELDSIGNSQRGETR